MASASAVVREWAFGPQDPIDDYIYTLSGKSPYTISDYRYILERLQDYLNAPLDLATVPELHAALFQFSQHYGLGKLRGCKTALRGFLKNIDKGEWLSCFPNPRIKWLPPEGPSPDDIDRALAACENDLERAVLLVSYSLGGRPGSIFGDKKARKPPAMIEDINWEAGTVRVADKMGPRVLVFQQRRKQTMNALKRYLKDRASGPVFPLTRSSAYKLLVKIGERAGLNKPIEDGWRQKNRNLCGNLLRHATGGNMERQGAGLFKIQAQLGHSDPNTTLVYVRIHQHDLISRAREREWR